MPYTVNDNLDPDNYPQPSNIIRVLNIMATQLKLLTGKSAFNEKPDYSIATAVQGEQGIQGIQGIPGQDGLSAYELWLAEGNSGDISAFLTSKLTTKTLQVNLVIPPNGYAIQAIALGNGYSLNKVTSTESNIRIRCYLNITFADADLTRAIGGDKPVNHGLVYESVLPTGTTSLDVLPSAIAIPNANTILVINNYNSDTISPTITFNYLQIKD